MPSPCAVKLPVDGVQGLDDVKSMIHKLYTSLNIDQHQVGVVVRGGCGMLACVFGKVNGYEGL